MHVSIKQHMGSGFRLMKTLIQIGLLSYVYAHEVAHYSCLGFEKREQTTTNCQTRTQPQSVYLTAQTNYPIPELDPKIRNIPLQFLKARDRGLHGSV